jgi:hypothetical protein
MRMILVTASLALLAACGGGNKSANGSAGNAAAAGPAGNFAGPSAAADPTPAAHRASEIGECSQDMGRHLPPGSDVAGLCGCAVDKVAAGTPQGEAVRQCADQLHITVPGLDGGGEAPDGNTAE